MRARLAAGSCWSPPTPSFPVFPGETTLNAASTLAAQGELSLVPVVVAGALGAIVGDSTLFWIARRNSRKGQASARARQAKQERRGPDLRVQGNIVDHEYEIEADGAKIAEISKRWFRLRDTYGVEVAPGQDEIVVLAVASSSTRWPTGRTKAKPSAAARRAIRSYA